MSAHDNKPISNCDSHNVVLPELTRTRIEEIKLSIPPTGSHWIHRGTGVEYVALKFCRGRLSGGQWRDGILYESLDGQACYWRCLRSWIESFEASNDNEATAKVLDHQGTENAP